MKKRHYMYLLALTAGVTFALGDLSPLFAQESKTDEFTLEEITVTAQKREENMQKVAISMETIKGDEIKELGKTNIDEILAGISNVIINTSADGMRVALRGLADDANLNQNMHVSTPTVAMNVDGAYNSNSNAGQNLFDVERVEVLFGPQSTMYASNSPGGIVNVVTAAPKTDKYSASGSFEWGSYKLKRTEAAVNVPLGSMFAMRAAGSWSEQASFTSGDATSRSKNARLKTLFQPNDKLSVTLTGTYSISSNGGMMGGQIKPFWKQDGYYADNTKITDPWTTETTASNAGPGGGGGGGNQGDQKTKGLNLGIVWDTGIGSLTITPAYSKSSADQDSTQNVDMNDATKGTYSTHTVQSTTQKGAEVRMASSSDFKLFKWVAGANYYSSDQEKLSTYSNQVNQGISNNKDKSKALFANITYPITDKFRGIGGYRKSWDNNSSYEYDPSRPSGPGGSSSSPSAASASTTSQKYSSPDTKIGVEYDLADNSMIYMDRSTSYRMQSMGMQNSSGESVPPERLTSYTLGAKNRFLENKLQLNVSAFYYNYKNKLANQMKQGTFAADTITADGVIIPQYNNGVLVTGSTTVTISDPNSQGWGTFRSYGLDVQTNWIVSNSDKVNLSVSYLDAKWKHLEFNYYYDNFADVSYNGQKNTFSPTWTLNASYDHNFVLWNGGSLTGRVDGQYQSSYVMSWRPITATNNATYRYDYQEPYYILNSSFVYAHPTGVWTLSTYVKNIMNYAKKTSVMSMDNPDGSSNVQSMMLGDPRTYGAVLSVKF